MPRAVNLVFRMLVMVALLLAQQTDCARATERDMVSHAHGAGDACHDDGVDGTPSEHADHGDGAGDSGCPASHSCPTIAAIAAAASAQSAAPAFADTPFRALRPLASVFVAPDRRPPKA